MNEIKGLISLLGEENVEELKKGLVKLLLEESTNKKVSKMYKDAVIEINQDYIQKMKDYMTHQVNETELRTKIFDYADQLKYKGNEFSKEYQISEELFKILKETEK